MALVGYARVSSVGQSLEVQLEKLKHCDKLYQEKKSGASGRRPQLKACLEYIREGDTLVVTRLDRLARSTLHLCQIAADLERKQVNLQVLDQNINTHSTTGRLLFNMLGAIAQFETEIRAERQMDGIQSSDIPVDYIQRGKPYEV
jgi:DNA invertase Pin-like site-specific DNA recombinase